MKVLIVGGGGREHALAWKLKQSPKVTELFVAPGNPGTAQVARKVEAKTVDEIVAWLGEHAVDLVVIGPDNYLAEGLTDRIREMNIPVFGPTKAAAEIEWSKAYAKQLMLEEGIPTARSRTFATAALAKDYVAGQKLPIVLKADGLALGKGVVIARTLEEANTAIDELMKSEAGARLVVEDYLEGFEVSFHALCDGEEAIVFPVAKDHKRIGEGDTGPNTGGMGTVAPVPLVPTEQVALVRERIILPTLRALKKRGRPFSGLLFPGVMLTRYGPFVIEFNARFGDPETQSYMRLLTSDLFNALYACATGTLSEVTLTWSKDAACCIVLASGGYPGDYEKGVTISGLPSDTDKVVLFHAGTREANGKLETSGGRVLGVTATGSDLKDALERAYGVAEAIQFEGKQYRRDIGATAI